ncbi:MAG: response regulator [Chromatiales bacterium]|nr:response regulator [Chromatiales bacterium]
MQALIFADTEAFLTAYQPDWPGCLLLDIRVPGRNDLDIQQHLYDLGIDVPVIIITGHGDVSMAVTAMKQGALDFTRKPFNDQLLLDCVHNALAEDQYGGAPARTAAGIAAPVRHLDAARAGCFAAGRTACPTGKSPRH